MKEVSLLRPSSAGETGPNAASVSQVLDSRTFEKTPALRALLEYLWRHREEAISEYAIATEALGRPASFDARTDATVRVQISRLRQRLEKFYEDEGQRCAERLIIPLGSHRVEVEECPQALVMQATESRVIAPAPVVVDVPAKEARWRRFLSIAVAVLVLICLAEAAILWQMRTTVPSVKAQAPGWVWKKLFANSRRTRIILPMPIFFSFTRPGADVRATVMLRDTEVNEFSQGPASSAYEALHRDLGEPKLAESYTVTSDTFASVELVRYLDRVGLNTSITSSADAPLEALDSENVVALGTWGTLTPLKPYLKTMSFELAPHEDHVVNRRPEPGEPARYSLVTESEDRNIWPGVIAFLPGSAANTHLMILASRHTLALVSFLTSTHGQEMLERMWKEKGSPEFFEVVVNSEMGGRGLVRFWPVTLHPYEKGP
jgi:hypothetical protein